MLWFEWFLSRFTCIVRLIQTVPQALFSLSRTIPGESALTWDLPSEVQILRLRTCSGWRAPDYRFITVLIRSERDLFGANYVFTACFS